MNRKWQRLPWWGPQALPPPAGRRPPLRETCQPHGGRRREADEIPFP